MSKLTNHLVFLFLILLTHVITSNEFFHFFREDLDLISFTAFSKMVLLILPSSFFPGLRILHSMLKGKLFLWSLMVIKVSAAENLGIFLFLYFFSCIIFSDFEFILFIKFSLEILYVFVKLSINSLL